MVDEGSLSSSAAKTVFEEMGRSKDKPEEIAARLKLVQVSDEAEVEKIVTEVIKQNPKASQDVKNGQAKAVGFLVGEVMAKSKGQANPGVAQKLIKKQLGV
jgi:aspartyl-tRNA(Asn)/glutamyl-tRNA(Gln) amidotransferase subunit B